MKRNKSVIEYDKSADIYFKEIGKTKPLTKDEEYSLWKKYKEENDIDSRNKLVSANLKFVATIAKKYIGMGLSYGELIAEGNVGLIKALDNFDGDKGFKIISYSVWWIKQSILEALKKRNVMDAEDLPNLKNKDDFIEEEDEEEIDENENIVFDEEENNDKIRDGKTMVGLLMNFLSEKERNIITIYYGLNGKKPKTLEEIGKELGISKERVRQINKNSFIKMRTAAMLLN